jgi:hypothetical protein
MLKIKSTESKFTNSIIKTFLNNPPHLQKDKFNELKKINCLRKKTSPKPLNAFSIFYKNLYKNAPLE